MSVTTEASSDHITAVLHPITNEDQPVATLGVGGFADDASTLSVNENTDPSQPTSAETLKELLTNGDVAKVLGDAVPELVHPIAIKTTDAPTVTDMSREHMVSSLGPGSDLEGVLGVYETDNLLPVSLPLEEEETETATISEQVVIAAQSDLIPVAMEPQTVTKEQEVIPLDIKDETATDEPSVVDTVAKTTEETQAETAVVDSQPSAIPDIIPAASSVASTQETLSAVEPDTESTPLDTETAPPASAPSIVEDAIESTQSAPTGNAATIVEPASLSDSVSAEAIVSETPEPSAEALSNPQDNAVVASEPLPVSEVVPNPVDDASIVEFAPEASVANVLEVTTVVVGDTPMVEEVTSAIEDKLREPSVQEEVSINEETKPIVKVQPAHGDAPIVEEVEVVIEDIQPTVEETIAVVVEETSPAPLEAVVEPVLEEVQPILEKVGPVSGEEVSIEEDEPIAEEVKTVAEPAVEGTKLVVEERAGSVTAEDVRLVLEEVQSVVEEAGPAVKGEVPVVTEPTVEEATPVGVEDVKPVVEEVVPAVQEEVPVLDEPAQSTLIEEEVFRDSPAEVAEIFVKAKFSEPVLEAAASAEDITESPAVYVPESVVQVAEPVNQDVEVAEVELAVQSENVADEEGQAVSVVEVAEPITEVTEPATEPVVGVTEPVVEEAAVRSEEAVAEEVPAASDTAATEPTAEVTEPPIESDIEAAEPVAEEVAVQSEEVVAEPFPEVAQPVAETTTPTAEAAETSEPLAEDLAIPEKVAVEETSAVAATGAGATEPVVEVTESVEVVEPIIQETAVQSEVIQETPAEVAAVLEPVTEATTISEEAIEETAIQSEVIEEAVIQSEVIEETAIQSEVIEETPAEVAAVMEPVTEATTISEEAIEETPTVFVTEVAGPIHTTEPTVEVAEIAEPVIAIEEVPAGVAMLSEPATEVTTSPEELIEETPAVAVIEVAELVVEAEDHVAEPAAEVAEISEPVVIMEETSAIPVAEVAEPIVEVAETAEVVEPIYEATETIAPVEEAVKETPVPTTVVTELVAEAAEPAVEVTPLVIEDAEPAQEQAEVPAQITEPVHEATIVGTPPVDSAPEVAEPVPEPVTVTTALEITEPLIEVPPIEALSTTQLVDTELVEAIEPPNVVAEPVVEEDVEEAPVDISNEVTETAAEAEEPPVEAVEALLAEPVVELAEPVTAPTPESVIPVVPEEDTSVASEPSAVVAPGQTLVVGEAPAPEAATPITEEAAGGVPVSLEEASAVDASVAENTVPFIVAEEPSAAIVDHVIGPEEPPVDELVTAQEPQVIEPAVETLGEIDSVGSVATVDSVTVITPTSELASAAEEEELPIQQNSTDEFSPAVDGEPTSAPVEADAVITDEILAVRELTQEDSSVAEESKSDMEDVLSTAVDEELQPVEHVADSVDEITRIPLDDELLAAPEDNESITVADRESFEVSRIIVTPPEEVDQSAAVEETPIEESPKAAPEMERPRSPWTPSFQVTTIGRGISPTDDDDVAEIEEPLTDVSSTAVDSDESADGPAEDTAPPLVDTDNSEEGTTAAINERVTPELVVDTSSLETPAEQSRPWTPSYSVHSQGTPLQHAVELGDDEEIPSIVAESSKPDLATELPTTTETMDILTPSPNDELSEQIVDTFANMNPAPAPSSEDDATLAPEVVDEEYLPAEVSIIEADHQQFVVEAVDSDIPTESFSLIKDDDSTSPEVLQNFDESNEEAAKLPSLHEESTSGAHLAPNNDHDQDRPKSPSSWVPSYSVSVQGSPLVGAAELGSLEEQQPNDILSNQSATKTIETPPEATSVLVADQVSSEDSELVDQEPNVIVKTQELIDDAPSAIHPISELEGSEPDKAVVPVEAVIPPPTVLVNGDNEESIDAQDVSAPPQEPVGSSLTPESETPERPKSPWTPSYSVTTQGSGLSAEEEEGLDTLEPLPQRALEVTQSFIEPTLGAGTTPIDNPVSHNDDTPSHTHTSSHTLIEEEVSGPGEALAPQTHLSSPEPPTTTPLQEAIAKAALAFHTNQQAFPTKEDVDEPRKSANSRPSISLLPPVYENTDINTTPGQSNNSSPDTSSSAPRARIESTTSSRFFPGGWFSTAKVPERTSLDIAQGEFTPSKPTSPAGDTITELPATAITPVTPTADDSEHKKAKWCVVM